MLTLSHSLQKGEKEKKELRVKYMVILIILIHDIFINYHFKMIILKLSNVFAIHKMDLF